MSPLATLLIVALTLFGMLPMYRWVAAESPHGHGSVAMLERLLPFWRGKLFVLALLGFVATSWIITITLSSADATAHFVENPFAPSFLTDQQDVISAFFIRGTVAVSFASRVTRVTELRADDIVFDETARTFLDRCIATGELHVIANKRQAGDLAEYRDKEREQRALNPVPDSCPIVFLEIDVSDPSESARELHVRGVEVDGYQVLRTDSPAVPNALAANMLRIRDETGTRPHLHFQWSEGHPLAHLVRYVLLGLGETAPVTREILRQHEKDLTRRPVVHVGG